MPHFAPSDSYLILRERSASDELGSEVCPAARSVHQACQKEGFSLSL